MQTIINFIKAFKQQALGVINLTGLVITLCYFYPTLLSSVSGRILCSVIIGIYVFFLNYQATKKIAASLQYVPSGATKELFEQAIQNCNMDPAAIRLRYGYTDEAIAMMIINTIAIDPLLWNDLNEDPEAIKCTNIINTLVIPVISVEKQQRLNNFKQALSAPVQQFIFKHELGHVYHNYAYKKLFLIFIISMLATFCGLVITQLLLSALGFGAIFLGALIGGCVDILLSYASNVFFKLYEEKRADFFAVQHSSLEEIEAAAQFFERCQEIRDMYPEPDNLFFKIPTVVLSGHMDGKSRATYLRSCKPSYAR